MGGNTTDQEVQTRNLAIYVLTGTFEYLGLINSIFPLYCGLNIFGLTASSHYNLSFVIVLLSIFLLYVEKWVGPPKLKEKK